MKVAVTYDNGEIFQHFGHSESFKVYDVDNGAVVSSEVINSNGSGHGALASLLSELGINAVICGGIGEGAVVALMEAGIEVCSGVSGNADEAVEYYIKGELDSEGINCDHHAEGGECHCGGGCGGGCGHHAPAIEGPNVGKTVKVHYTGTLNDGTKFDSSYDRDQPLEFVCGIGMMIPGFDKAVAVMELGSTVDIHLMPEEAYGLANPDYIMTEKLSELPGAEDLTVGQQVMLQNPYGQSFPVLVTAKTEDTITFDANHELAGKELNFKIELLEIA